MRLKIWRLHPDGARIEPAEKTLGGTAHKNAVKWCGPYATANRLGWWLYSPVDLDVLWKGGKDFEYRMLSDYTDRDYHLVRELIRPEDEVDPERWSPSGGRTKFTWGAADAGVFQVWTGLIFQTPPGWGLYATTPVNRPMRGLRVQEGVIESDWLQYDIWTNLIVLRPHTWVYLRREGPPIAQLIPIPRESYEPDWDVDQEMVNRDSEESEKVFKFWIDYNHRKFGQGGNQIIDERYPDIRKNSATYHLTRKEILGKKERDENDEVGEGS